MLEVYLTENKDVYTKIKQYLLRFLRSPFKILRTENGKPYIEGNPLFFSLSHSANWAVIAICDKPVGVDFEVFNGKVHPAVCSRFSQREQEEINCEKDFLLHWTAREAFIKMKGATLSEYFKKLEFYGGEIYFDGERQNLKIDLNEYPFGVCAVCCDN